MSTFVRGDSFLSAPTKSICCIIYLDQNTPHMAVMVMLLQGDHKRNVERDPLRITGGSLFKAEMLTEECSAYRAQLPVFSTLPHSFGFNYVSSTMSVLSLVHVLILLSTFCLCRTVSVFTFCSIFFFFIRALKQNVSTKRDEV